MMIVLETDTTRVIIELATKTGVGAKINTKTKTGRDDSYDQIRGRSRERHCSYYARKVANSLKLELFHNIA